MFLLKYGEKCRLSIGFARYGGLCGTGSVIAPANFAGRSRQGRVLGGCRNGRCRLMVLLKYGEKYRLSIRFARPGGLRSTGPVIAPASFGGKSRRGRQSGSGGL